MTSSSVPRRTPAPWLFFLLILPYGTSFGFISVAFAYLATHSAHPISTEQVLIIVAAAYVPHTWKMLWAPVVDETLTKKTWYLIALVLTVAGTLAIAAMPIEPDKIPLITTVVVVSQVGLTLMGFACESLLGLAVPDDQKGRASGWYNAGNNFGSGVGGGAALWLAQHLAAPWLSGVLLGALMLLCAIPLMYFDEPLRQHARSLGEAARSRLAKIVEALQDLGRNLWQLVTTRKGIVGFVICISPIAAGGSAQLFAPAANWWHVSGNTVALITGVLGGLAMSGGSMVGGYFADRIRRRVLYAISGALMGSTALLLAFTPHIPLTYVVLTLVYQFFFGISYAAFTALVLETIGGGAVATKYNLFTFAMNGAISYMAVVVGKAEGAWGVRGALLTDAACTLGGIVVVMTLITLVLRSSGRQPVQSSQPDLP